MTEVHDENKTDEPGLYLKAETLFGDIRDGILDEIRRMEKPWTDLTAGEQRMIIGGVSRLSRVLVDGAFDAVMNFDTPQIEVTVGPYVGKDGTLTFKLACEDNDENLIAVARTKKAVLVMTDPSKFMGARGEAKATPDQGEMPLGEEQPAHDPETGEILVEQPESDGLSAEEATERFEEAKAAAEEKQARRSRKKAGEAMPETPERELADA